MSNIDIINIDIIINIMFNCESITDVINFAKTCRLMHEAYTTSRNKLLCHHQVNWDHLCKLGVTSTYIHLHNDFSYLPYSFSAAVFANKHLLRWLIKMDCAAISTIISALAYDNRFDIIIDLNLIKPIFEHLITNINNGHITRLNSDMITSINNENTYNVLLLGTWLVNNAEHDMVINFLKCIKHVCNHEFMKEIIFRQAYIQFKHDITKKLHISNDSYLQMFDRIFNIHILTKQPFKHHNEMFLDIEKNKIDMRKNVYVVLILLACKNMIKEYKDIYENRGYMIGGYNISNVSLEDTYKSMQFFICLQMKDIIEITKQLVGSDSPRIILSYNSIGKIINVDNHPIININTYMIFACKSNLINAVKYYLNCNYDKDMLKYFVECAATNGNYNIVKLLIAAGGNVNDITSDVAIGGNLKIIKMLPALSIKNYHSLITCMRLISNANNMGNNQLIDFLKNPYF